MLNYDKMEYWKINCLLKHETNAYWLNNRFLTDIIIFLWHREYDGSSFDRNHTVKAPDKLIYILSTKWNEEDKVVSIVIKNESAWKDRYGLEGPQIVKLIEDYFKLNYNHWYLIETLNEKEDKNINQFGRIVTPLQIIQVLKNWNEEQSKKSVEIIEIGEYKDAQTDMFKGSKQEFESCLDFWISCIYWISCGEIKPNNLIYCRNKNYFDIFFGSCIPIDGSEIHEILLQIEQNANDLKKDSVINSMLMRKDWNDKIYIIEYDKYYVMHNWHTGE